MAVERYDYIKRKRFTEPQTWTYEWDGAGQLIAVSNNEQKDMGGQPVRLRFEYDALGRRTAKISVWGRSVYHRVTRFLWDGDIPLHEWTYEGSEPPKTKLTKEGHRYYPKGEPETELTTWLFEEGTFVPLAKLVGERSYSIACDHLGTPTAAYDEEGNRVWQRELDIYGRVRQEEGETNFIPFLFQGQYYDHETGLAYNRFRYYAPEWGMYISQDPIRLEAGLSNLYAYVHDTNGWIDPFGLIAEVYKLVAVKDGFYDVYEWGHSKPVGKVYLRAGETWKIGETTQFRIRKHKPPIQIRYSQTWLAKMGLKYETLQHSPNKSAKSSFMVYETNRIQKHELRFGMKPPGNKCTH